MSTFIGLLYNYIGPLIIDVTIECTTDVYIPINNNGISSVHALFCNGAAIGHF